MSNYQEMAVIYFDILGSKNMNTFDKKYEIHKLFHESVKVSQARQGSEHLSHVAHERRLYSFSDCCFIFYFYKDGIDDSRKDNRKLMQVALYNTSIMLTKLMSRGYFVRGGATLGDAYLDHDGFFGPAVECAYKLGEIKGSPPRVLIEPIVAQKLFEFESSIQEDEEVKIFNHQLRDSFARIVLHEDGTYFLNVLYHLEMESVLNYDGEELTLDQIKRKAMETITTGIEENGEDQSIVKKLEWMQSYIGSVRCRLNNGLSSFSFTI